VARANSSFDIDENGGPEIQKNMFVGNPDIHSMEQRYGAVFLGRKPFCTQRSY
jgi:hypothetical protein